MVPQDVPHYNLSTAAAEALPRTGGGAGLQQLARRAQAGARKLNFYHQVQLRRQHLPAAQDAHHGGAQQHVRVAALVHRAGDARVVHFVETLHGLAAIVLSALRHGAAVVVDVVAALAVGEDLDALDEAGGQAGLGVAGASGLVPSVFLTRKAILMDSGSMKDVPLVSGMRQTLEVVKAGEVLHVMPRRHVAGVACFQLVAQALHQLILGSGGDYLHACLYTRILTRTAKQNYSSSAYIDIRTRGIAFCGAKSGKTS